MSSITIRNVDEDLKARLRVQAAQHGRSLSDEALWMLRQHVGLTPAPALVTGDSLAQRIHARFAAVYQAHGEGTPQLINPWTP